MAEAVAACAASWRPAIGPWPGRITTGPSAAASIGGAEATDNIASEGLVAECCIATLASLAPVWTKKPADLAAPAPGILAPGSTYRLAFPGRLRGDPSGCRAFVLGYSCGTAPDLHRLP